MKKLLRPAVCAAALLFVGVSTGAVLTPAIAQDDGSVDFDTFHAQLAPYGDWVYSDRWGEVWIPQDVADDFHPYGTNGHWVNTEDYGLTWVSDYEWGDIPFHYGRWVNDPNDGWMWIPGYVWSPGWVAWRHNGQYTGWMPMPPDDAFMGRAPRQNSIGIAIGGLALSFSNTDDDYGYSRWYGNDYNQDRFASNWVFVGTGHMADRDYRRYEAPRGNYSSIIRSSTNITNYTVVNNYVVNRSVDPGAIARAGGHIQTVKFADVTKHPQFITRADAGHDVQTRMRARMPRGTGLANSAPKPSDAVVQSLSTKAPRVRSGKPAGHLFTRDTVAKAPLAAKPAEPSGNAMAAPMTAKPEKADKHPGMMQTPAAPEPLSAHAPMAGEKHGDKGTMPAPQAPVAPKDTVTPKSDHMGSMPTHETPATASPPPPMKAGKHHDDMGPAQPGTAPAAEPSGKHHGHDGMSGPAPAAKTTAPEAAKPAPHETASPPASKAPPEKPTTEKKGKHSKDDAPH